MFLAGNLRACNRVAKFPEALALQEAPGCSLEGAITVGEDVQAGQGQGGGAGTARCQPRAGSDRRASIQDCHLLENEVW